MKNKSDKLEKDCADTKGKLNEKHEEYIKIKKEYDILNNRLRFFTESKALITEKLLGDLHELVSDLTKDIEMNENQENEYQRIMGSLDETIKANEIQKIESNNNYHTCKQKVNDLEMKLEDFEEKINQLEKQNTLLKEQVKVNTERNKELKVMENDEFDRIQKEKNDMEDTIREKNNEISIIKDKNKQTIEELNELNKKYNTTRDELTIMAKQLSDKNDQYNQLENKYKYIKDKYAEAREGVINKYESRYKSKEKELEMVYQKKYAEIDNHISNQVVNDGSTNKPDDTNNKGMNDNERMNYDQTIEELHQQIEIYKNEILDVRNRCIDKDNEIISLENKINEIAKKREIVKQNSIDSPESTNSGSNINLKRLVKYLDSFEVNTKQLYKDFVKYSTLRDERLADEVQLKMNKLIEQNDDIREYVLMKMNSK